MTISNKIKRLRKEAKISQVDLAEKLGTTKQTIYKYENGLITNIPSDKIEIMARLFGTTPAYLMGWDETTANQEGGSEKIMTVLKRRKDLLACVNLLVENESEINENDVEKTMTMIETFFLDKKDKE